jgi:DNA polymerase III subunit delta'
VALADPPAALPGIDAHAHARAVLGAALAPGGSPSHAYLFHGPRGTGKRTVARGFAAALLADGSADPAAAAERVARGSHPDLGWVTPSGAAEMLVADIDEPVVAAAAHTPFEASRRVFVIEDVETMNDQAANRMLKTLEEPPPYVHLLLLTERLQDVLPTIASRCQHVRFDPLPPASLAARLAERRPGADPERLRACARLALGDAHEAALLAGEEGDALRARAEGLIRAAIAGRAGDRPWMAMLELARAAGERSGEQARERLHDELELVGSKERKRYEREGLDARRRLERRARTRALDRMLGLSELWLRDVLCLCEGAGEMVHAVDRRPELEHDADAVDGARVREALALVQDTRLRLALHVSEELALEALAYRLESLLAP